MQLQMFKNTKCMHFWEPTQHSPVRGWVGIGTCSQGREQKAQKMLLGTQTEVLSALHTLSTGRALKMQ